MAYEITLLPGDGIGPEVMQAATRVIEATGVKFDWDIQPVGEGALAEHGTPLPEQVLDSIRRTGLGFKGPITTPVGTGFRSVNVAIRKSLDLYACVRPCKTYPAVRGRYDDVDIVVVRENTEDLYAGIEFEKDSAEVQELVQFFRDKGSVIRDDVGISIKPISVFGTQRIVRYAFDYAIEHGRKKVTAVHKANIMKYSDGLFLAVAREVAEEYPNIEFEDRIVDNMFMQLVQRPEEYDVLVLPNLYGDIASDLCSGLVGGLGVAPGANIGANGMAVFEAIHGSAPRYTGQNRVNPIACILSGMLMLEHLGEKEAARQVDEAVAAVIAEGKSVTYDMKPTRDDPSAVGTSQVADAIIEKM